eukprot:1119418-Prorocentrum_minimum.AAC.1
MDQSDTVNVDIFPRRTNPIVPHPSGLLLRRSKLRNRWCATGAPPQFHKKDLKLVSTVPYAKNTLVFFINSDHSVHG